LLLGLTPISIATPFFSTQSTQAYAAIPLSAEMVKSTLLTAFSIVKGLVSVVPLELEEFKLLNNCDSGIDLSVVAGNRMAVLAIPEELRGHVAPNGTGAIACNHT
jgi:hypothetical protein